MMIVVVVYNIILHIYTRKSSVHGHRSAARYTTVIIIIIDDGIVNSLCKMDCSGTVIFGRKRGEIMIIIEYTMCVCVCSGPSKNGAKNTPRRPSPICDREKKNYTLYVMKKIKKSAEQKNRSLRRV